MVCFQLYSDTYLLQHLKLNAFIPLLDILKASLIVEYIVQWPWLRYYKILNILESCIYILVLIVNKCDVCPGIKVVSLHSFSFLTKSMWKADISNFYERLQYNPPFLLEFASRKYHWKPVGTRQLFCPNMGIHSNPNLSFTWDWIQYL